jgi:ribose transport system substrate-binding protein
MFPQLKVNNSIPTPRPKWVSTILLILVLMAVACGRQQTRKIYTPSLTGIPIPTESIAEPAQAMSQQEITPELPSPTETPLVNTTSMSGGIAFHQPAVQTFNGQRPFKIGLLTGMQDPFFVTLVHGARQAAVNLSVELYAQLPQNWSSTEQVLLLDALLARGDLDALLLTPVETQALIPDLQKAAEAGILIMTIQSRLPEIPGVSPYATINTDNRLGGFLVCQALIESLAASVEEKDKTPIPPKKLYIQKGKPGILDPDAREQGCTEAIAQATDKPFEIQLAGTDIHNDDPLKASQQVLAIIASEPELSAIVCTDMICTQAASQALASLGLRGEIKIATFDATPAAVELLRLGSIDFLVTPKPFDMGYLGVVMATSALDGVTSLPPDQTTGWEIITRQNINDPVVARRFYDANTGNPQAGNLTSSSAGLKFAFVAGIDDPFYYTMQRGAQQAANSLGLELLSQFPTNWSATEQIQIIGTLSSRNKLNALLLVPTDPMALIPSLESLANANIPILALDTSLDVSITPLAALSSNNQDGGYFACHSLAQSLGGRGKFYIQNVTPGIATTDARERGCQRALSEFPEATLVAVNYNDDDPAKAQAQLATIMQNYPDLSAVFCTDVLGAQAVGQYLGDQGFSGKVKVAAFDATSATIDLLRHGIIDMVVAQKPADMGYLGVLFAVARLDGITDLTRTVSTGFALLTRDNMDDPQYSRYFYTK